MIPYTVVWTHDALDELAELWLGAGDRAAVNRAAAAIDAALANDPNSKGEHVAEGLRKLIQVPLAVLFSVRDQDRIAEVSMVGTASLRPPGA